MSGDQTRPVAEDADQVTGPAPAAPAGGGNAPGRPRSAAAAAASRARRIGGRAVPGRPAPARTRTDAGPAPLSLRKETAPAPEVQPDSPPAEPAAAPAEAAAAPAEAAAAAEPAAAPTGGAPVPAWANWAPAAVLTAGALVMAVLLAVLSHGVWWGPDPGRAPSAAKVSQVRDQVQAAAKSCVAATNDYSYTALDAYETKALACTTGQFTGKLRNTIQNLVKKNAPALKAKQTTRINRSGIQSVTPDGKQWTILVFGQLSVVNANYPDGRTDPFGALVTMEKTSGKWLMANLDTVSSPVSGG